MRYTFFLLLTIFLQSSLSADAQAPQTRRVNKIVLDAGHGGEDGGARGVFSSEKDLTLAIVLKLGKLLNDSLKGTQVIYTRTSDIYPSLKERHAIANKANADLFISVHINSTAGRTERIQTGTKTVKRGKKKIAVPVYKTIRHRETEAAGTMTLVLGNIRNNQKSSAMQDNLSEDEGLLNPDDPQTAIIIAQYMAAYLERSVTLGSHIQEQFVKVGRIDHGGVKQQSLEVLAGSYMPGVLVECGFINNPAEEIYMNSEQGKNDLALAIFRGIKAYKRDIER